MKPNSEIESAYRCKHSNAVQSKYRQPDNWLPLYRNSTIIQRNSEPAFAGFRSPTLVGPLPQENYLKKRKLTENQNPQIQVESTNAIASSLN